MKKAAVVSLFVLCLSLVIPVIDLPGPGEAADDNILRIGLLKEPATLDAQKINISSEGTIVADLGATLLAADPETGEPVPYLATSWSTSDDGLVWTFHLRDDVRFHDGTPLTAEEYVWTITRILSLTDPASFVPKALLSRVTAARAVDPYTLELLLESPDATLLTNLTSQYLQPLSPQAVESAGDNYGQQPVGVGPFRFKEWLPGQKIVMERNPDFTWGPSFTGGGPAVIDQIEYNIIPDYDIALVQLLEGQIDVLNLGHADARQVLDTSNLSLISVTMGSTFFLELDITEPPLNDIRVRQALNYALDRDQLVLFVEYGYGIPLYGPVSPASVGFWPESEAFGLHYDPAKVSALLTDAGYTLDAENRWAKEGEPLVLTGLYPTYAAAPQMPQIAAALSDQFRQLGIKMNFVPVEKLLVDMYPLDTFDLTLQAVTWPEATFIMLNISLSSGQSNIVHMNDPELDQLLLGSLTSLDPEVSRQLLWDAQKRIIENAYYVPLYSPPVLYAVNTRVQNYRITSYGRWLIDTIIE